MHDLTVQMVPMDEIERHPDNPNHGDVDAIVQSIEHNGFYQPILVQASTGYIVAGNHRWEALLREGASEAPVIYLDLTDEQAARIMVADNQTARLGTNNPVELVKLLDRLAKTDVGLAGTGHSPGDLLRMLEDIERVSSPLDSEAPERKPRAKDDLYRVYPERDGDACYSVTVELAEGGEITPADYNRIRKALGLARETRDDVKGYEIANWDGAVV